MGCKVKNILFSIITIFFLFTFITGCNLINPASELIIEDYYPKSGAAGSPVYLKFETPLSDILEELQAFYNDNEVLITGVSDDTFRVLLPADAASGSIQVKAGLSKSNTVYFTVEDIEVTPLYTETLSPSSEEQSINSDDEISVTLPPDFLDTQRTISLSSVTNPPSNSINPFAKNLAYEVSIDGLEELKDYIEIKAEYDLELLNPDYSPADQLMAMRWNEEEQFWLPLPYQVDIENQTLNFYTDHLCIFVIGSVVGGILTIPVTWLGEKLLNNVYITPDLNFRILYSKSSIEESQIFDDSPWTGAIYKNPLYPITSYYTNHPKFIQDMNNLLEKALNSYVAVHDFKDPITTPGLLWGTSKNPITVKIDSWWVSLGGSPNYEKIWERIHLPTSVLSDFQYNQSYGTIGHELFHRIQAEYYGISGFLNSANFWWIEASAEYAGYRVAWPGKKFDALHEKTGFDFFSYPLSTTGKINNANGWNLNQSYEYAASAFIQFLVEKKGLNFKDMIEHVAKGSPFEKLNNYDGLNLSDTYRDFAAWGIFCSDSFLNKYEISQISIGNQELTLEQNESIEITFTGGQNSKIYIYKFDKEFIKTSVIPEPLTFLSSEEKLEITSTKNGDVIYLLAVNIGDQNELLDIAVTTLSDDVIKSSLSFGKTVKGSYSANLWAITIEKEEENETIPFDLSIENLYLTNAFNMILSSSGNLGLPTGAFSSIADLSIGKEIAIVATSSTEGNVDLNGTYDTDITLKTVTVDEPGGTGSSWTHEKGGYRFENSITNFRTILTNKLLNWSDSTQAKGTYSITLPVNTDANYDIYFAFDYNQDVFTYDSDEHEWVFYENQNGTSRTLLVHLYISVW